MNITYSINEHRHRFAAWAAARAANRGVRGLTTKLAREWLEQIGFTDLISDPNKLPSQSAFDEQHATWRAKLADLAQPSNIRLRGFHQHPRVKSLHPPVDSILLRGMVANGFGNADDFEGIHWTKLNSSGYQKVIDAIRSATKTGPLWEVEKFWRS
jgi:hypothetical protein